MTYRNEYSREGQVLGSELSGPTIQDAIAQAQDEMKVHHVDFVRIIDIDGGGVEVWSGKNDDQGT